MDKFFEIGACHQFIPSVRGESASMRSVSAVISGPIEFGAPACPQESATVICIAVNWYRFTIKLLICFSSVVALNQRVLGSSPPAPTNNF